jgi:hypothetical protein
LQKQKVALLIGPAPIDATIQNEETHLHAALIETLLASVAIQFVDRDSVE